MSEQLYAYYTEPFSLEDRPRRFLNAFSAILNRTHYGPVLDHYFIAAGPEFRSDGLAPNS